VLCSTLRLDHFASIWHAQDLPGADTSALVLVVGDAVVISSKGIFTVVVVVVVVVGLCVVCGTATQITTTDRNGFLKTKNKDKPVGRAVMCVTEAFRIVKRLKDG